MAIPAGLEPATDRLEICCSIRMSYGTGTPWERASVGPEVLAPIREMVGIGLDGPARSLRFEHLILDAMLPGIGDRFFPGVETERDLGVRIARTRPAHKRLDTTRASRLELENPFSGLGAA